MISVIFIPVIIGQVMLFLLYGKKTMLLSEKIKQSIQSDLSEAKLISVKDLLEKK